MTTKREKERGRGAACSTQGVWDKQHKPFIATSALAHERDREREKEKGAIDCGVREVCKVGNGL